MDTPDDTTSPTPSPFDKDAALALLRGGEVAEVHGLIRNSSNYTFLVTMKDASGEHHAIYKPKRGERPLWDFPDGSLADRELASFLVSEALGWGVVPPTVMRDGPNGPGSYQWFIEHDPAENYFTFGERVLAQLRMLCAFDCITNNADRKGGHILMGEGDRIWAIDNGLTFNVAHKLRTVVWDFQGEEVAPRLLSDLRGLRDRLCEPADPLTVQLNVHLVSGEITAFQHRIERLLKSGRYPKAGPSGPHYPWPPV
ncbi:MAG: SCO1664 family protein [Anaerolineae bacterium]|jgi:hypothetical protein|nr:SCO1664 family protein [Anaerolineae bacterium]